MRRKLIPKTAIPAEDSVAYEKLYYSKDKKQMDVVFKAARAWDCMKRFRQERDRNKRYMFGDQWGDRIEYCGQMIPEEEYIKLQGNIPLKNNLIRGIVRKVVSVYRNQNKVPICVARDRDEQQLGETMSTMMEYNYKLNDKKELDARMFEEFVMSGLAIQKEVYSRRHNIQDCWTTNTNPNYVFMDGPMLDPRMDDLVIIGELHDLTFGKLASLFAHSDKDLESLNRIYLNARNKDYMLSYLDTFKKNDESMLSFLTPLDMNLCRVIEVWTLEQRKALWCHDYLRGDAYIDTYANKNVIDMENAGRLEDNKQKDENGNYILDEYGEIKLFMPEEQVPLIEYEYTIENYWYYRFIAPTGEVLEEGESPYEHESHPYTVKAYPLLDGEIHSFVSDFIDQQRFINHYIILNDFIMKSSSKGVLIVDEDSIPSDLRIEDIAEEWTRFNGVIKLKLKQGAKPPQQMVNQSKVAGLQDMIALQMQMMSDISGVHGALQGKDAPSGTSGALYQQQAANSATSMADILETYSCFLIADAKKKLKNMQQFYDEPKKERVAGRQETVIYDPKTMAGVDFDLSITESYDTPVYRAISNQMLIDFMNSKQISLEQALQVGAFPFGDKLLQLIQSDKQKLMEQQMAMQQQGQPQQMMPQ